MRTTMVQISLRIRELISVGEQAGLNLTWSETPKTGFLVTWLIYIVTILYILHCLLSVDSLVTVLLPCSYLSIFVSCYMLEHNCVVDLNVYDIFLFNWTEHNIKTHLLIT